MAGRRAVVLVTAVLLAACATTALRDQWVDASYRGGPFRKLLVLGVSSHVSERRTFEDLMVARLVAAGVDAIPAYRLLPSAEKVPEAALDDAVRASGADGLLMSRVVGLDRRVSATTSLAPAHGLGWYGLYTRWYPVTEVREYEVASVETSLFAPDGKRVVWSGMTETYEPTSVARDGPAFARVIVGALQHRGLLPASK